MKTVSEERKNTNITALLEIGGLSSVDDIRYSFAARSSPPFWQFCLIGPLAAAFMKQYQVVLTEQELLFARLGAFGGIAGVDRFSYQELKNVSWKRNPLEYRIKVEFKNGRVLKLRSNHRALVKVTHFLSSEDALNYLKGRIG